jgi:hypothetical protein
MDLMFGVSIAMTAQRASIADGGEVEKPPLGNRSSLFIQRLKIYSIVQKSSFCPNRS